MTKPKRVAFYLRVSTGGQTTENQRLELTAVAERAGWEIIDVYEDVGISGSKGRDQRPGYDALLRDATKRRFDLVAAWSVDRLGRSLQDLVGFLKELHTLGIDLYLHQQGLDTTTSGGKAMFGMMGVFAQFERAMIRERVNAGLARARAQGKQLGRPRIAPELEQRIRDARATKQGIKAIARQLGVGADTVQRVVRTEPQTATTIILENGQPSIDA